MSVAHSSDPNDCLLSGALSIARSMPYVHWLTRLDLRSNIIGDQVCAEPWWEEPQTLHAGGPGYETLDPPGTHTLAHTLQWT